MSIEFTQLMDTQRISTDAMMNFATQYEMQDRTSPAYLKRLNEAQKYLTALQRRQTRVRLQEAMTFQSSVRINVGPNGIPQHSDLHSGGFNPP